MFKARCHSKKEIQNFYNIEGSDDLLLDKIVDCGNTSLCYEVSNWGEGALGGFRIRRVELKESQIPLCLR